MSQDSSPHTTPRTTDEVLAGVDLTGRTVVVTGASAGLGLETARALAAAGAHVVMASRNPQKSAAALQGILDRHPTAALEHVELDLASLASVRSAAAQILDRHSEIHLLVNNAGVMFTPFGRTADGFELQLGTNHLGHFLLTELLTPALLAAAPSRVVVLSSAGHSLGSVDFDDPSYERRPYDKFEAYGQAKTANALFALELNRRLEPRGVRAYSVHPGIIATELARYMDEADLAEMVRLTKLNRPPRDSATTAGTPRRSLRAGTVDVGAATTVWAATAPELDAQGGAYLADCALGRARSHATDPELAARLWELSEALIAQAEPATSTP